MSISNTIITTEEKIEVVKRIFKSAQIEELSEKLNLLSKECQKEIDRKVYTRGA